MSGTETTRASCLPLLLVAVATGGNAPMTRDAIALRTGFTRVQTANTLGNAVHRGYFQASGQMREGQQCWVLTEKGLERAADAQQRGVRLPDEAQALSPEVLADRALALVTKAPGGLDTSVILVLESTFVEATARGESPPGLRAALVLGSPDFMRH